MEFQSLLRKIRHPKLWKLSFEKWGLMHLSDKECIELCFEYKFAYKPDIEHPTTFNEKIQWMKLYYRKPELPLLVDKAEAKAKVAKIIGEEYIIPTIGVYKSFDEIDFDKLPKQFVIKCTHDCASVIICRDKPTFDIENARRKINKALRVKYYGKKTREWVYSQIEPRIIVEKFMKNDATDDIVDYKFFCFNGEPRLMYISKGLENHATAVIGFADMDYKLLDIERTDYRKMDNLPPKPESFEEMIQLAKKLSAGFPQVRVDLYEINGRPYFGEMTFYTCSGMVDWKKREYDERLGAIISLPEEITSRE